MAVLKTVKIASDETEQGFLTINECDFDSEVHMIYSESSQTEKEETSRPKLKKPIIKNQ